MDCLRSRDDRQRPSPARAPATYDGPCGPLRCWRCGMAVMVVGAGFDGTGTGVLAVALDRLGLGPCLDLREWRAHPERLAAWEEANNGGSADWDAMLGG